jgi:HPt (histidine-containing phosphotransfer) domain-containing protein
LPIYLMATVTMASAGTGRIIVDTEKQGVSGTNREIMTGALQSQGTRFNHLKSDRFDPESLWDRVDGNLELLRELNQVFAEESPKMLARIEDAVRRGSPADLEKSAHKIKGSVLQFSAQAAAATALALEEMGRRGSVAGAEPLLQTLQQEITLLQAALNSMVCSDRAL